MELNEVGGMRFGSLFAGIGGMDLGLERAGMKCAWQVENHPYAARVLAKHWPWTPRYGDITALDAYELLRRHDSVDLLAGGFPCQDISKAHSRRTRKGLKGSKSGLWSHYVRFIHHLRPKWAIVENVPPWSRWVPSVRRALWKLGYASLPIRMCPSEFGGRHERPRCFVVAYADQNGQPLGTLHEKVAALREVPKSLALGWTPPAEAVGMDDGLLHGMDRLRCLGNSAVPQIVQWLGQQIVELDEVS